MVEEQVGNLGASAGGSSTEEVANSLTAEKILIEMRVLLTQLDALGLAVAAAHLSMAIDSIADR